MAKKKTSSITIFELIWYLLCGLVCAWGSTYSILGVIAKYSDIKALSKFDDSFEKLFGLNLFFWGLIIIAISVVAAIIVLLIYAKKFDRATERERRRSIRLGALRKKNKVVADQEPEIVEEEAEEQLEESAPAEEIVV